MFKNYTEAIMWINEISGVWLEFLLNASFQLTVFAMLIAILSFFFHNRSAIFLLCLWSLVLLKIMLPPSINFPFNNQTQWIPEIVYPVLTLTALDASVEDTQLSLQSCLFIFWVLVAIGLLIYLVFKNVKFYIKLGDSTRFYRKYIPANLKKQFEKNKIQLMLNRTIPIPFTAGIFRPKIYLPGSAMFWQNDQLEAILLHELAHIQRKDSLVGLIQHLAQIVFFFHPVIWITNRQINKFRERTCDDFVLANSQNTALTYSKLLISFIDQSSRSGMFSHAVNYFHQTNKILIQRFQYLINQKEKIMMKLNLTEKILIGLFVCLAFGISMLNVRCSEIQQPLVENEAVLKKEINSEEFQKFDQAPAPIGGFQAIQQNLHYPEIAKRAGIEGTLVLQVQILENGHIGEIKILKSLGNNGCDEAAVKAIQKTKWTPAFLNGKAVKVRVAMPIIFKLPKRNSKDNSNPLPPPPPIKSKTSANENDEFKIVAYDAEPTPIGGFKAIQQNLHYPEIARRAGIEGTVVVQALIDESGAVVDTKILNSLGDNGCDEAAAEAIKKVKWQPAAKEGRPVKVRVRIPVIFKLDK